ncbi:UNC5C-like protein isoform X2 [Ptychodera flava]|uniref:UNC5C-like protein isoform X2 n=1 Tax=Ptychodera flava TaxID=63121 RepID=UPI00396A5A18
MEDEDVVLYIPPDAIEKGQRQPVFCHLSDFNSVSSDSGMVPLTPTVNCGPDGVNFEREVVLTIPHCATNAESWKFTGVTETTDGALITLPDENLMVNNSSIVLLLRHFTLFGAKGEATEENAQINVMIGVRCQCTDNRSCDIRVGAWIDMKSDHTRKLNTFRLEAKKYGKYMSESQLELKTKY